MMSSFIIPISGKVYLEFLPVKITIFFIGILTRDEKLIQEAATKLGVGKFYQLLALMVSRKEYKDIMDGKESDYNKRLRLPNKEEQQEMVKQLNADIVKQITILFDEMNK